MIYFIQYFYKVVLLRSRMSEMVHGTASSIKEININLVRSQMLSGQEMTKPQLAAATGLSVVTIGSILQCLLDSGEVVESGSIPSNGGRPAQLYRCDPDQTHIAIVYCYEKEAVDTANYMVIDLFGKCLYRKEQKFAPGEINLSSFKVQLSEMLAGDPKIILIAFGLPAVDLGGKIRCDYEGLNQERFAEYYQKLYNLPVIFENDVNAACLGYCRIHQIKQQPALFYMYIPQKYCPGSALCIDGRIYRGYNNYAGELRANSFDIPWTDPHFFNDKKAMCEKLARMLIGVSAVIAPQQIVLCCEGIDELQVLEIKQIFKKEYDEIALPEICKSQSFAEDFEAGMIQTALNSIEPKLSLQKTL